MVYATKGWVEKRIRRNTEVKWLGVSIDNLPINNKIDSTTLFTELAPVPQGDTDGSRDGDKMSPNSLIVKLKFTNSSTTAINTVRVLLILWKPSTNLLSFNPNQVFNNTFTATDVAPLSQYLWDYRNMFKVLYDELFVIGSNGTPNGFIVRDLFFNLKGNPQIAFYAGDAAKSSNNYYIMFISDSASTNIACTMNSRFTFVDS